MYLCTMFVSMYVSMNVYNEEGARNMTTDYILTIIQGTVLLRLLKELPGMKSTDHFLGWVVYILYYNGQNMVISIDGNML